VADQPGYTPTKDQLLTRLRRIEGQIRSLQRMVEPISTASTC
jgi:DNA-binding FrmR family transcriptional regulator